MSGIPFKVRIVSSDVEAEINRLTSARTQKEVLDTVGRVFLTKVQLGFRAQKSPYGNKWPPLVFRSGTPLRDTGQFFQSITYSTTADSVKIGTNKQVSYKGRSHSLGDIHQFGRTILPIPPNTKLAVPIKKGRKKRIVLLDKAVIPPRPFLPIRPDKEADLPESWQKSALSAISRVLRG